MHFSLYDSGPFCEYDGMRRLLLMTFSALVLIGAVSCRTKDIRTMIIQVPAMKNAACVDVVTKAVARCPGVLAA